MIDIDAYKQLIGSLTKLVMDATDADAQGQMTELLPCAHCGGEAVMQRSSSEIRWNSAFVVCEDCGIQTCFCETTTGDAADIAIAIWNRRVGVLTIKGAK